MMTYFEARGRRDHLLEFRRLYREYSGFTNKENNIPAQVLLQKLEPMTALTVDSLRRIGLGSMITHDAPSKGGRKIRINIIKAIFRPHLIRHFSLEDTDVLRLLDRGIVKYRVRVWQQAINLFNPIFWLVQLIGFVADIPFHVFRRAGFETDRLEKKSSVRAYRLVVQVLLLVLLLKLTGVLDWIRFDILAL